MMIRSAGAMGFLRGPDCQSSLVIRTIGKRKNSSYSPHFCLWLSILLAIEVYISPTCALSMRLFTAIPRSTIQHLQRRRYLSLSPAPVLVPQQLKVYTTRSNKHSIPHTRKLSMAPTKYRTEMQKVTGPAEFSAPGCPGLLNFPQCSGETTKTLAELIQKNHDTVS